MFPRFMQPRSLAEAAACRASDGESALLAGGTDLLVRVYGRRLKPSIIIDLNRVKELSGTIAFSDGGIRIGALATLTDVARSGALREHVPAVAEAAQVMGSRQIRNRGTVVGNLCNASPAADTAPPLLVYEAAVEISDGERTRTVPVQSFFKGPGRTVLMQNEIVVSVYIPFPPEGSGSCYRRMSRRRGVDLAIVGVAGLVAPDGEVRLALGAVGPTPLRAHEAESALRGKAEDAEARVAGLGLLASEATPISDVRASKAYRAAMVKAFANRVLDECVACRTRGRGHDSPSG